MIAFSNAFIGWNYNVLAEDMHTCSLAESYDYIADKMHDKVDRDIISILDKIFIEQGDSRKKGDSNEGPSDITVSNRQPTIMRWSPMQECCIWK